MRVLAISTSVLCYARIMVNMVDAVSGFKMLSEFYVAWRQIQTYSRARSQACLSSSLRAFSIVAYLHRPASVIFSSTTSLRPSPYDRGLPDSSIVKA